MRRATFCGSKADKPQTSSISIHALREEGDGEPMSIEVKGLGISIHALREEGDALLNTAAKRDKRISIHALREEGDGYDEMAIEDWSDFNPRPP